MRTPRFLLSLCLITAASLSAAVAQTAEISILRSAPSAATSATAVPMLIRYDGVAVRGSGNAAANRATITFLIYKEEKGGDALWIETQDVVPDAAGRYEVYLGSTYSAGLPPTLFGAGEARWLEVQITGETPSPRVLLTSVPYALKAADAATLGGLPASAFALAGTTTAVTPVELKGVTPDTNSSVTTTGGTNLYLPKFNGTSTVISSEIYDSGTSVGIGGVPNASAKLDVNGAMIMRGNMQVTRTGNATTSEGYPSYGFQFFANAYNSSSKAADNPYFQLQSEPSGNNTSSPSATFNLLFSNSGSAPAETGLSVNSNGTINFASGQTFPATSSSATAVDGTSTSSNGVQGNSTSSNGVYGQSSTGAGVQGLTSGKVSTAGVLGIAGSGNTSGFAGVAGVWGDSNASRGVIGTSTESAGVTGESANAIGVDGSSTSSYGVRGSTSDTGGGFAGVYGVSGATDPGVQGTSYAGDGGHFFGGNISSANDPVPFSAGVGVQGTGGSSSNVFGGNGGDFYGGSASASGYNGGYGVYAEAGTNPDGNLSYAVVTKGDVVVNGNLYADTKYFRIDHPLDPANKYLNHASIESSEMVNIYSGNVTTDSQGTATVQLPDWFEALNRDLRYQLTPIGQFAQAMVATELSNGRFTIRTDKGNVKVSWQITGVRQDAYARAHPLVVEEEKDAHERGSYKHPELYGQPKEKQTDWGRHPVATQKIRATQ